MADDPEKELAEREALTVARVVLGLADVVRQLRSDYLSLDSDAARRTTLGLAVTKRWVARSSAYQHTVSLLDVGLGRVARLVGDSVVQLRTHATQAGAAQAASLAESLGGDGSQLSEARVAAMVAELDRGPLDAILTRHARETSAAAGQVLLESVATRRDVRSTAKLLGQVLDVPRWQALSIARTEQYRAYREAQRQTWLADEGVTGWTWVANLDRRTCGFCWSQHGLEFLLEEKPAAHVSCRCRMVPVTARTRGRRTGEQRFAELSEAAQNAVLGPAAAEAYRDGLFTLADVAGHIEHPHWGRTGRVRSLRELLGDDVRATYLAAVRNR
ncbi:phage minor head protein [uncultured Friedmanniella sp.]|uniref:phage minor head protein n=1 Tax=uncultured Friedmanniella sp. TaxID=335381 RepID=UPI0035CBFCFE